MAHSDHPMSGNSKVGDDGAPTIYINPRDGQKLDVILHELYHFKLRTRGYPVVQWLFPAYMDTEANRASFEQLRQQLYDPILHYVFYPEVRASFGINPGETFEQRTLKILDDQSLVSRCASMDRGAVALYYFKFRLEVADEEISRRVLALLERVSSREGILLGKRLERTVRQVNQRSPTNAITSLVDCLNIFYEGQFRFEQHQWSSRRLGEHIEQIAPIELKSVQ
jgi:hypothetical protein